MTSMIENPNTKQSIRDSRSLRDFFEKMGTEWRGKGAIYLLCIWSLLPFWSFISHIYWEYGKTDVNMDYAQVIVLDSYRGSVFFAGEITVLFAVVYLVQELVLKGKHCFRRLQESIWYIALLAMLLQVCIATVFSQDRANSLAGSDYRYEGLGMYFIYGAVLVVAGLLKERKAKRMVFVCFSTVASIIGMTVILQDAGVPFFADYFVVVRAAVFFQFNHLGYYLCMSILCLMGMIIFEEKGKLLFTAELFLQMYALLVNSTLGAYLGVLVGLVFLGVFVFAGKERKPFRKYLLIPIAIFLLTTFMSFMEWIPTSSGETMRVNIMQIFRDVKDISEGEGDDAGHGRVTLWKAGLEMIPKHPLVGYGPENMDPEISETIWNDRVDNEVLQYAIYLGIPGAVYYVLGILLLAIRRLRKLKTLSPGVLIAAACVIGYFFSSMLGNSMFYTAPYYWMFLGMVAAREPEPVEGDVPQKG